MNGRRTSARPGPRLGWGRALAPVGVAFALVLPGVAQALQGGEDPSTLPVLMDKQHGLGGTHQLSLSFSGAILTDYTTGLGASLSYQYGLSDLFGLELSGAFYSVGETELMKNIRASFSRSAEPDLSDMYGIKYDALLNLVFVPVYGRLSFSSEFDPSFDIYVLAGGGLVGTERKYGADGSGTLSTTTVGFDWGLGLRIYFSELLALRLEYRSVYFPEPANYEASVGGLTSVQYFQGGLQFTFGGAR